MLSVPLGQSVAAALYIIVLACYVGHLERKSQGSRSSCSNAWIHLNTWAVFPCWSVTALIGPLIVLHIKQGVPPCWRVLEGGWNHDETHHPSSILRPNLRAECWVRLLLNSGASTLCVDLLAKKTHTPGWKKFLFQDYSKLGFSNNHGDFRGYRND